MTFQSQDRSASSDAADTIGEGDTSDPNLKKIEKYSLFGIGLDPDSGTEDTGEDIQSPTESE